MRLTDIKKEDLLAHKEKPITIKVQEKSKNGLTVTVEDGENEIFIPEEKLGLYKKLEQQEGF